MKPVKCNVSLYDVRDLNLRECAYVVRCLDLGLLEGGTNQTIDACLLNNGFYLTKPCA